MHILENIKLQFFMADRLMQLDDRNGMGYEPFRTCVVEN